MRSSGLQADRGLASDLQGFKSAGFDYWVVDRKCCEKAGPVLHIIREFGPERDRRGQRECNMHAAAANGSVVDSCITTGLPSIYDWRQ